MATYSHSRLKSFLECPRKFLWRYVWSVRPSVEGVEAFLGKRVHEALEALYRTVSRAEGLPTRSQLIRDFERRWHRHWSDSVRIVRDREPGHYLQVGRDCLARYYGRHHPFDAGTTLGLEKAFQIPVDQGSSHQLRGIMDRIDVAADGTLEVHDYKTGRQASRLDELERDRQVGFYELAARHLYPHHRRVRLVWHFLQAGLERSIPSRRPEVLAALRREAADQIERIEERVGAYAASLSGSSASSLGASSGAALRSVPQPAREPTDLFPARVGPLCRWCSFLDWCREGAVHTGRPFCPPPPDPVPQLAPDRGAAGVQGRLF